jgi:integrase
MATVKFLYRSTKPKSALTIRLLFRNEGKDYQLESRTRHYVEKDYWEKYHNSSRIRDARIRKIQLDVKAELNNLQTHLFESFYSSSIDIIDKSWLVETVEQFYAPDLKGSRRGETLIEVLQSYVSFKGKDLASSTAKKYGVLVQKLRRYEEHIGKNLYVSNIDLSFKENFEGYCTEEGYAQNTIARDFKAIKTVCKFASRRGVEISPELNEVRLKSVPAETICLTAEDISKIECLTNIPEYLDNARDWLLLSCYTGQRISDFMRFDKSMVGERRLEDGRQFPVLEFIQAKTKSPLTFPLTKEIAKILKKRSGNFPRPIQDQVYNRFIKEVCRLAGLTSQVYGSKKGLVSEGSNKWRQKTGHYEKWELVSSHIGRRSFATNHYGKIPTATLCKVTGHKTEEMLLRYVKKNEADLTSIFYDYFDL